MKVAWGGLERKHLFWQIRHCMVIPFQELKVIGVARSGLEVKLLSSQKLRLVNYCVCYCLQTVVSVCKCSKCVYINQIDSCPLRFWYLELI